MLQHSSRPLLYLVRTCITLNPAAFRSLPPGFTLYSIQMTRDLHPSRRPEALNIHHKSPRPFCYEPTSKDPEPSTINGPSLKQDEWKTRTEPERTYRRVPGQAENTENLPHKLSVRPKEAAWNSISHKPSSCRPHKIEA